MAKITQQPTVQIEITFTINESEARALDALAGYGDDAFIKHFKETLSAHYIRGHEDGLREFLSSIRGCVSGILSRADKARKTFNDR